MGVAEHFKQPFCRSTTLLARGLIMKPVRHFLSQQRGSIAIYAALTVLPVLSVWAFQVEASRYQTRQMRLHQAQSMAVQAMAKEGWTATETEKDALANEYVAQNLATVLDPESGDDAQLTVQQDGDVLSLAAQLPYAAVLEPVAKLIWPEVDQTLSAEMVFRPTETAFVMDASASMAFPKDAVAAVREGMQGYISEAFRNRDASDDFWVSLVAYSGKVNIGWSAKDKLITPKSRKIPLQARLVAADYGWLHSDDLLHPAGTEGLRQGACVNRKPLTSTGAVKMYLDSVIERPPARAEEGFELFVEHGKSLEYEHWRTKEKIKETSLATTTLERPSGLDAVRDIGMQVPFADKNVFPPDWMTKHNRHNVHDLSRAVGAAYDCAHMPMLVGSRSKAELLRRLEMYVPTASTGGDDGLAWGYRALNPNWRGIWQATYPANYDRSKLDKKLVLFSDGYNNVGYGGGTRWRPSPNIIPALCQRMKEQGIEISVLLFDVGGNFDTGSALKDYQQCASQPDLFKYVKQTKDIRHFLREWGKRKYQVRLVPS
jgi:Flp pilus assembly protein TadG